MGNEWLKIQAEISHLQAQYQPFFVSGIGPSQGRNSVGLFHKNPATQDRYVGQGSSTKKPTLWTGLRKTPFQFPKLFSDEFVRSLAWDPDFIIKAGRVKRGFDEDSDKRSRQAKQILKSFAAWPPKEGELFAIQIDQDTPPPLPERPPPEERLQDGQTSPQEAAYQAALSQLKNYLFQYSGEMVLFRAKKINGQIEMVELNTNGPFQAASHPGQLHTSIKACIKGVCGIPWLRAGIYPYKTHNYGFVFYPTYEKFMWSAKDINEDGTIDQQESKDSEKSYGLGMNIHLGLKNSPKSIGCQTLPPDDFKTMVKIINESGLEKFKYVLVRRPNDITGTYEW